MRSPLKDKPLRNPGQSLDEQIRDIGLDAIGLFMLGGFMLLLAALEWWRSYMGTPPAPKTMTVVALLVMLVCAIRIRMHLQNMRHCKLGRDGEMAVGQFLEHLRSQHAMVFHDVHGENFNIDHVVISEKGIYLVETKTWSKPDKGEAIIHYDSKVLRKNDYVVDPPPTHQAHAAARFLEELLEASTGKPFRVQPIVTFPGWYVECKTFSTTYEPWVLNPKAIPTFIQKARKTLSAEDARLAAFHLGRYVKTT